MVADRTERNMELTTDQSSQNNATLLDSYLNKTDFRAAFKEDPADKAQNFLPSGDQVLALMNNDDPQESYAGGGGKTASSVDYGDDGRVSKVTYPDGKTLGFSYDKSGQLYVIRDGDAFWVRNPDGSWDKWRNYEDGPDDSVGKANWQVDQNGNVTFDNEDRTIGRVTSPDGKSTAIQRDKNGHVTKVDYPGPDKREFKYDKDGDLTKVKYPNGYYYEKEKDGTWELHRPNGSRTGDKLSQITVDKDGTILAKSADKQTMTKRDPLGQKHTWKLIDL